MTEIVLSPFYQVEDEYRVIMLNHDVEYVFRKERRFVIGDGVSTIKTLLPQFGHKLTQKSGIPNTPEFLQRTPPSGEKVYVTWKHNGFTAHRIAVDSSDPLQIEIRDIATRASKALAMAFCCVDLIKPEQALPLVLEVNSDTWVEPHEVGYDDVKKTYTKVVRQALGIRESFCTRIQNFFWKSIRQY
jgi:hypothetical protein